MIVIGGFVKYTTAWVVAAGHRPWYVSSTTNCTVCQKAFEPIFLEYSVDIALFGMSLILST